VAGLLRSRTGGLLAFAGLVAGEVAVSRTAPDLQPWTWLSAVDALAGSPAAGLLPRGAAAAVAVAWVALACLLALLAGIRRDVA